MAINELKYKNTTITTLRDASCMLNESISLSTLPVDTLTATVVDEEGTLKALFSAQQYGEVVRYFHSGSQFGKFYLEEIEQVGPIDWRFNCISDIGLLVSSDHYGGLYNGEKASVVIADVIGGIIPYTLDAALQEVEIYGWLKKASRRDNLRDVLFAIGGTIRRDAEGNCVIAPYEADPEPYPILSSSFYKTGGSVTGGTPATQAVLTEHAFAARDTDEVETLFDGEIVGEDIVTPKGASVNGIIVVFDEPHYAFSVQSATILESGVNYAVLGSAAYGLLTGKKYTHTQRTLIRNGEATGTPNIVQSSKCALVNIRNSPSVADRVIAFYGYATKVTTDLVLTTQRPGDFVSFTDPYGISREGYIQSLEITMSKVMKALATIVCNFIPPVDVPMYFHHELIFSSQEWTVPEDVTSVRVVLIGGGPGGPSGVEGKPNNPTGKTHNRGPHRTSGSSHYYNIYSTDVAPTAGGAGGKGSPGADGGKVYSTTIEVTSGQKFQITIGQGGAGGVNAGAGSVAGSPGGATTFGSLSSESGDVVPNGYFEEVTGQTYAGKGNTGIDGGAGVTGKGRLQTSSFWGDQEMVFEYEIPAGVVYNGVTYVPGQKQGTEIYTSSESGSASQNGGEVSRGFAWGLGGGAAAGVNGPNSTNRKGATGAKPITPPAQTKAGYGGHGGHGGGGAGGNGGMSASRRIRSDKTPQSSPGGTQGSQQSGGLGGDGGKGAPGACFLYYYSPEEPTE